MFIQDVAQEEMPAEMTADEAVTPPAPEPAAAPEQTLSAGEEAASALERAIAALRAGQSPTSTTPPAEPFQFQAAPQPEATVEPESIPMAVPMGEQEPQAETHPEPEADFEPSIEPSFEAPLEPPPALEPMDEAETEPELVLTEVETVVIETEEIAEDVAPEEDIPSEPERAPFWPAQASEEEEQPVEFAGEPEPSLDVVEESETVFESEPVFEPEVEPVVAQTNGSAAHHDVPGKSLEDSVKDMLRPMLRQWLDENMPRMIRDELDTDTLRRPEE